MPGGDGTGPSGQGPGTGRGYGGRRGQMGGTGAGPAGKCVCPNCGTEADHQTGVPCYDITCPKCGAKMIRKV